MSDSGRAVFLSYASQDAAAAQRICAALRAAGVEVWFDQNELTGGDAWDAKIRRQVASCALFLPVISAATQARLEGYFRIEWKLAAQRTHAMADEKAFLLPVVIDDTRDADAKVPAEFKAVQWTRLPGGETREKFCARVKTLLGGSELEPGRPRPGERGEGAASPAAGAVSPAIPANVSRRVPAAAWVAAAIVVLGVTYFVFPPRRSPEEIAALIARAQAIGAEAAKKSITPAAAWPRDAGLRRAMELVNGTDAIDVDFLLAEEIATKALAKNGTDLDAVTVMARVQVAYLFRGFDRSEERRAKARRFAERAVQLGPKDAEAVGALGVFLVSAGDILRGRELLEQAIQLKPDDSFFHRHRNNGLFFDAKVPRAEALAAAEKTAALFPGDALAHYELGRHYRDLGRVAEAEREFDRCIAIAPITNAIVWKASVALWIRGDVAEMKALLDRVPSRTRGGERAVFSRWNYAMVTGDGEDALDGLAGLTGKWVEDFYFNGPKALLIAQLLELQGKRELARLQYESALAEVKARQALAPTDATLRGIESWVLHGLRRDEEARPLSRVALESLARPFGLSPLSGWWFTSIPRCLLLGERATAIQLIREAMSVGPAGGEQRFDEEFRFSISEPASAVRAALRQRFKFDPRMAPFRDDPEIAALLAEPKK